MDAGRQQGQVGRKEPEAFVRERRKLLLVSTYPTRAKAKNLCKRRAMRDRSEVAIDIEVTDWGPVATGGVPPEYA